MIAGGVVGVDAENQFAEVAVAGDQDAIVSTACRGRPVVRASAPHRLARDDIMARGDERLARSCCRHSRRTSNLKPRAPRPIATIALVVIRSARRTRRCPQMLRQDCPDTHRRSGHRPTRAHQLQHALDRDARSTNTGLPPRMPGPNGYGRASSSRPHRSIRIRVGSSIAFFSATRNVTASRPSIRRWS